MSEQNVTQLQASSHNGKIQPSLRKSHNSIPRTSAVNIALSELIVVEKEKPVSCFSALVGVIKKHSGRNNRCQKQQSVTSIHSSNDDAQQKENGSPIASDTTNEKNGAPRERGDFSSSLDTSLTRLHLRLEYLGRKKQMKTVIFEKGSFLADELKKHDMYIEANMFLMCRKPNVKDSYGTFQEKKMLDLGEEVLFRNVNSKAMRNSELHIHVRLTNAKCQSIPMGSVIIDCMDYCPGRENIFPIPMTRYY